MKILEVKNLSLPEVKVIHFQRFLDERGYFTESFRKSDFAAEINLGFLKGVDFVQHNESYSVAQVMRGLHFQWQPPLGKLVRLAYGQLLDAALDIRKGSPNFGKIILYKLQTSPKNDFGEWIWLPPGFAHGLCFLEESLVEYFCTSEYNPNAEASISPLAEDLDWSLCDSGLKAEFDKIKSSPIISQKDSLGFSLKQWEADEKSKNFIYLA